MSTIDNDCFVVALKAHEQLKCALLELIDEQESQGILGGNDRIYRTDFFHNNSEAKYWKLLEGELVSTIKECLVASLGVDPLDFDESNITRYWFQQYIFGDTHDWHIHRHTDYTAVYHLELPEDAPATEFKYPQRNGVERAKAKEGDVVIFPASLLHRSPPNVGGRKTSIALNIDLK